MALSKVKKRIIIIASAVLCALMAAAVLIWFFCPWIYGALGLPEDMIKRGRFTGYDAVVVADDTPDEELEELSRYHIDYIEYDEGKMLVGDGGMLSLSDFHGEPKIYLCSGNYNAETGDFISYKGELPITVCGAGEGKTVITGGTRVAENSGRAFYISGTEGSVISGSVIKDLTVDSFAYGVYLKYAHKSEISGVTLIRNHNGGIVFDGTDGCKVSDCRLELNGDPETDDTGYGISLLYGSRDNAVDAEYVNNGGKNAVDFAGRCESELPEDNAFTLKKEYTLESGEQTVRDPAEEAQNAKPTESGVKYELENAVIDNTGSVLSNSTEKVENFSGDGFVFLFNTKITLNIDVAEEGNYRIFVVGTSDDGENKCDYFQVNGGEKYFTSFSGAEKGKWQTCQPGTENWENNQLRPLAPTDGFALKKGSNTIEITANWGYCCYDYIIVEKIQ